ncbi:nucleoside monophosphate kinase [Propionicicella superfundia]|uniref:nucleoside monophosphate kinase n=1 Tax=Propionicicella superfundia TaxID=348582 RepID=UPI00146C9046
MSVLGLPGSGKTSQARTLARSLDWPYLGAGGWLRGRAAQGDVAAERCVASGRPMSPRLFSQFWDGVASVLRETTGPGVVLDGIPRDRNQLTLMESVLSPGGLCHAVWILGLPADLALERVVGRHSGRADDAAETAQARIEGEVRNLTALRLAFDGYPKARLLVCDATLPLDRVARGGADFVSANISAWQYEGRGTS